MDPRGRAMGPGGAQLRAQAWVESSGRVVRGVGMSARVLALLGIALTAGCSAGTVGPDPRFGTAKLALGAHADPMTRGGCALDPSVDPLALTYQTPSRLRVGVVSMALLHQAAEAGGFSLGPSGGFAEFDLTHGATLSRALWSSIPEGTYTHVRVGLSSLELEVAAVAHTGGQSVRGTLEVDQAVADQAAPRRAQGDYRATFSAFGHSMQTSGSIPIADYGAPVPGGAVSTGGGKYELVVPIPGGAITVDHDTPRDIDIEIAFAIQDAFAWQNVAGPGYTAREFDLSLSDPSDVAVGLCVRATTRIGNAPDAGIGPLDPDAGITDPDAGSTSPDAGTSPLDPDASTTPDATTTPDASTTPDAGTLVGPGDRRCVDTDLGFTTGVAAQGFRPLTTAAATGSCGGQGEEIVFLFTAPSAGNYAFDTAGSTYDTVLYARAAACIGAELGCNDDPPAGGLAARLVLPLVQGQTVVLYLDAVSSWAQDPASIGIYVLNIERP